MSNVIDNEIVRMQFDNAQFESNVKTSMSTIEKLKASLNFDAAKDSFKQIDKAAATVDFSKMEKSLDSLDRKISVIGIAWAKVIMDMTAKVEHFAKSITANLTVVPIKAGLQEYENQIDSVQTIMANTGRNVKDVNAALDELNEYADLTIYNFGQMTSNVGKFTAAIGKTPGGLEKSTQAIKGIGNWAAFAGANATQMATATYQLSQALGAGAIKLQDWRSVENASMAGMNFQEAFKETAREMGIAVDAAIAKEGTFRNSLKEGWLTTEVFFKTMDKFANDPAMTDAATKVKTFTQLIDVLKEALGTGWATTWRSVIGDFEEAKAFFTSVSDLLTGVINNANDSRNKVIGEWASGLKDIAEYSNGYQTGMTEFWGGDSGRKDLIKSIENLTNAFATLIGPAGEAWDVVFGPLTSDSLKSLSQKVEDFTHSLILNVDAQSDVKKTFIGIFSVLKTFSGLLGSVLKFAGSTLQAISPLILVLLRLAAALGIIVKALLDAATEFNVAGKIFSAIQIVIMSLVLVILRLFEVIKNNAFVQKILNDISVGFERFLSAISNIKTGAINKFLDLLIKVRDIFTNFVLGPKKKATSGGAFAGVHEMHKDMAINNSKLADLAKTGRLEMKKSSDELENTEKEHKNILAKCVRTMGNSAKTVSKAGSSAVESVNDSANGVYKAISGIKLDDFVDKLKNALAVGAIVAGVVTICAALYRLSASFALLGESAEVAGKTANAYLNKAGLTYLIGFLKNFAAAAIIATAAILGIKYIIDNYFWDVKDTVSDGISTAYSGVESSVDKVQSIGNKIKTVLTDIYNNSNLANKTLGENIRRMLGLGMFVGTITAATVSLYNISKAFGGFGEGLEAVGKGIRNYLTGKALDEMSDALYAFSAALLSAAGAMWIISVIDPTRLQTAVKIVAGIAGAIVVIMAIMVNMNTEVKKAAEVSDATAKAVGDGKNGIFGKLASAFGNVKSGIAGFIESVKKAVAMTAQIAAVSIGLLSFVGALWLFVEVIDKYSKLKPDELAAGLENMSVPFLLLTAAVLTLGLAAKKANFMGMALSITAFVGSLYLLIDLFGKFTAFITDSEYSYGEMESGLTALAVTMGALAVSVSIVGLSVKKSALGFVGATAFLAAFTVALYAFVGVAKLLQDSSDGVWAAIGAIAAFTIAISSLSAVLGVFSNKSKTIFDASENVKSIEEFRSLAGALAAAGIAIVGLSGALFIFAKAAQELSSVNLFDLGKANVELIALGTGLIVMAQILNRVKWQPLMGFASMSLAFVGTLFLLRFVRGKEILKGIAVLGAVIVALLAISRLAGGKDLKMGMSSFVGIGADMLSLVTSLFALQFIPWSAIGKALAMYIPILAAIGLCAKLASSADDKAGKAAFSGIASTIVAMTLALTALSVIPAKELIPAALAIDMVGAIVAIMLNALSKIKEYPKDTMKVLLTLLGGMSVMLGAFGGALALIKNDSSAPKKIIALGTMMTLLQTSVIGSLYAISKIDLDSINKKTILGLIAMMSGMAALGAGIAYASTKMGNNDKAVYALGTMGSLVTIAASLATRLAEFDGSAGDLVKTVVAFTAIGAVMAAITGALTYFSTFANASNYVTLITGAIITIAAVGAAAYALSSIGQQIAENTHWILAAGLTIGLFAAEISSLMLLVLAAIGGITSSGLGESINNGINFIQMVFVKIAETFGLMYEAFSGGIINAVGNFLRTTGTVLRDFVASMEGVSFDSIIKAGLLIFLVAMIAAANLMVEFTDILSDARIERFNSKIEELGAMLTRFNDSIKDVDSTAVKNAAEAIAVLFVALALAPRSGGLIDLLIGSNDDLGNVGRQLIKFGQSLSKYATAIATVHNWDTVGTATEHIKRIFEALKQAPNRGGFISKLSGDNDDLKSMGKNLESFGKYLSKYALHLSEIKNWITVATATGYIKNIFEALKEAPNSGGLISHIEGDNDDLESIGKNLATFGRHLSEYADWLSEVNNWSTVADATGYIKDIFEALKQAPVTDVFGYLNGTNNDVDEAGDALKWFGESMVDFAEIISDISDWDSVKNGVDIMADIFETLDNFPEPLPELFGDEKKSEEFQDGMHDIGRGIKKFADAIGSTDLESARDTVEIFESIVYIIKNLDIDNIGNIVRVTEKMLEIGRNIRQFFDEMHDQGVVDVSALIESYAKLVDQMSQLSSLSSDLSDFVDNFSGSKFAEAARDVDKLTNSLKTLNSTKDKVMLDDNRTGGGSDKINPQAIARVGLPTKAQVTRHLKDIGDLTAVGAKSSALRATAEATTVHEDWWEWITGKSGESGSEAGDEYGENYVDRVKSRLGDIKTAISPSIDKFSGFLKSSDNKTLKGLGEGLESIMNLGNSITSGDYSGFAEFDIFGGIEEKVNEAMEGINDLGGAFDDIDGDDKSKKKKEKKLLSENEYWKQLLEIKQHGADASKYIDMDLADFQESILKDYTKMMDDFLDEYKSKNEEMSKNITGMSQVSMFRNKDGKIDYEFTDNEGHMDWKTIQQNLYDQELAARRYTNAMRLINDRVSNEALLKELNDLGIEDLEYLEVVANLSDKQLKEFETRSVNILTQGHEAAAQAMFTKSKELETEANKLLGTDLNIDQLTQMWNGMMSSLDNMVAADQGRFVEDGQHITEGIATGMVGEAARVAIGDAISEVGTAIDDEGIREEMGIESPAKRMKPVGEFITAGVAVGMDPTKDSMARLVVGVATRNISVTTYNMLMDAIRNRHFEKIGEYILEGVKRGLDNGSGAVMSAVSRIASKIDSTFRKPLRIESPSKVFEENGMYIDMGLANGINNHTGLVENATSNLANTALSSMQTAIALANDSLLNESGPSITPVWNSESIQNGINSMDSALMAQRSFLMANAAAANMDTSINKTITIDNHQAVDAITKLNNDMLALEERIGSLQVVLNSGILVGEMAPGMNDELGAIAMRGLREGAG